MGTFYKIWDFVESFIRLAEKDINSDPFFFLIAWLEVYIASSSVSC